MALVVNYVSFASKYVPLSVNCVSCAIEYVSLVVNRQISDDPTLLLSNDLTSPCITNVTWTLCAPWGSSTVMVLVGFWRFDHDDAVMVECMRERIDIHLCL